MASRRKGSNSSRNSEATVQNGTRNGYGHSYLQRTTGPNGTTVNGPGPANQSQRELYDGSTNVYYGYGGPFRPDNDTDRSSEISVRSDDFLGNYKHQQWMDKITGDTFKRNYLDRISFRPTLAHDPSIPLQDTRDFRHDDNHNISQHAQDPSGYKKEKNRNTLKKVLIAILVLLLLGGISGVLAWYFTIKGDEDTSINYYVVTSEMALSNDYNPELSDSSSQEFKNLSTQFCDAITEALRKNNTEYGDRYKHCEVTAFKNGSIIVFYKLFYVFLEVQITKEKVQKDLNKSLTNVDPERAKLSDFVIIRASVKFTVEVQTFQTDPIVPSAQLITSTTEILPTTEETTTSEAVTTTAAKSTEAMITTEVKTTGESTTATTETTSSTTKEATSTMAVATTTVEATTTPPPSPTTSEATSTTAEATTTTAESTTTTAPPPLSTTTTAESTTLTTTTPLTPTTTTTAEGTSTTAGATTTIESTTTTAPPPLTTTTTSITAESTTPTTTTPLTTTTTTTAEATTTEAPSTTTLAATSILESISTTADATTTIESTTTTAPPPLTTTTTSITAESTTPTTTPALTTTTTTAKATTTEASSTTTLAATSTLEAISTIADATTTTARESTTLTTTPPLTTITSETTTTEATTTLSATSTLETISTTSYATSTTAESTTPPTTTSTTEAPSTLFTTERSTRITSVASSESLKTSTTIGTSESSPKQTTVDTTESSTSTTMGLSILTTKGTTEMSTSLTTQSSTISTIGTTEVSGSTTMVTTTTSEQYTAEIVVSPMIAIYGETTTTKTCVVSPRGNWVHITVTVENQGISYPIRKYHSNKTFEEPASLERFNASISSSDTEIVVYLSLDLQAPTTDMCSWDGKYTFSCSITMNDTIPTRVYNGSQIFLTAPISDVTIDSNVHYNEGDKMTFNCSSKGDPNHSMVYTELVKGSTVLQTIPGPEFSSGYNHTSDNNCLADLQWSGDSPNPLTTYQNDVIVRCTVKNTLLNESRTSEKRLNVSVVEYESSTISMSTTESSTTSTTMDTTESSTTSTTMDTTESSTTTTSVLKYSADVAVFPVIAIFGETATTEVCAITPHGDWLFATLTVEYQNTQYVIGKIHSNSSLEEPHSLERFNISISNKNMDIVVHLTLNLQTPTTDTCSMDGKYTFMCSITMNDTMQTLESNGSQIFMTAPMSEISIDSEVNYNEGEKMTFNCSMTGDPNYSTVYVDMIKNSQILYTIPGPVFGADYISNCSAVLNWSGGPPTPLTSQEHDLIVRCVVKNNLLNETRNSEKKLNVSAADVAFQKYSYQALTSSRQEIECIARSPMSILQELIILKDDVQIATLNSSGVASSTDGRYSTNIQEYDGEVRLTLSILSVECQDQGRYSCKLNTTNNATRVSPEMSFIVEGSKPAMKLHPDIYEPFARLGLNHVCSTEHIGDENNDNFLEIQIFQPGSQRAFTYSNKIADVEKMFDSTNNITYINITGTTAQFLLVSHTSSSSNLSCNNKETITFLLDLKMGFDNGTIKCVLKDEMEEFSAVESTITVIPGNFCDGYEDGAYRKHPNNDCNDYVNCNKIQGKMYATGNRCPLGQCIQFTTRYCVPCDSTFTCDELTTPGPTTTTTTLRPGRRYVSCNDSAHFLGTTAVIRCVILDISFNSLNITFLPEQSQTEENVGEIFPDGQTQSLPQSPVVLSTNLNLSPKILMFTFQLLECSSRGLYRIMAGDTNSSVAPSVETFELNVLGNLTEFLIHTEPEYPEGTLVDFNCTASLDESHANIKGYYKKESESSFSEIEGSTSVIERNLSHCFVKVLWKPSTPFTADTSFNNADLKCTLVDWPLVQSTKKISVQNADVAFETYKLESSIGSQVSVKCFARNTNSIKSILIRKIENSVNTTVANVTLPDMTSHVDGIIVSYSNNSLTLTFSSLTCSDDGQYTCIVIKEDDSQIESPAYLRVQIKNPPKHEQVVFILNPDIKENKYDTSNVHTCSGDVGYPSGLGYLSLKFTDPTTNASFTYDKLTVTEDMKIALDLPLKFKVSLSSGLSIIIVEDDEPAIINCTRKKEIKFLLQATRDWNKAKIRCRVISETNEVNSTSHEKEIYVIPDSVCDGSNGSDIYVPHEKIDQCRTYIRCFNNKPTGQICQTADLCFDHQKNYCDWCRDVACESEMSLTTESQTTTTTSSLPAVPDIQCPLLSCKPSSVFEMETGNITCELNTSMLYENITVIKNGSAIMTVYPDGTNHYFSDEIEKYDSTVGTSFTFVIKNVSCSDENEYTFTVEVGEGGSCYKTASLEMKAKPGTPTLAIDYTWTEGTNLGTHSCTGSIGNPPGTMTLEIRDRETGNFTSFSPSTKSLTTMKKNCHNNATLTFSIDFNTENIQSHYIRCVADSQHTLLISESPFYSREVFVNPLPANACFENGLHPYPGDCTQFLNCFSNITRVSQCQPGLCFKTSYCGSNCTGCNT
ncbi:serine-rich adhesin for platelets-like isoform X3 [Crassostrea angulata]|uniref:serine-rich adhesin for platelets-like isoform X3 n=1 Tax=Magallana angulata TaxID=2784310 RepID=UPI0022B1C7CE|nr:serine-rich adhesin for platelets-like isoform X3 [Crassostrea angulata]